VYPTYLFADRPIAVVQLGPSLSYRLAFVDSATQRPTSGVDVRFQRTAGIQVDAQSFHATTDTSGTVRVTLRPLAVGDLRGDLVIAPSGASAPTKIVDFVMPTFDSDSTLVLARWQIGRAGALYTLPPLAKP
jgi:hypothetical protein